MRTKKLIFSFVCLFLAICFLLIGNSTSTVQAYNEDNFKNFTSKSFVLLDAVEQ